MITLLARIAAGLSADGRNPLLRRYLISTTVYAISEGAAFGLLVPLLTALLGGHTADAAWWLLPLAGCVAVGWVGHYDMGVRALELSSAWRRSLYERIGDHVVALPLGWFDGNRTGQIEQLLGRGVGTAVRSVNLAQTLISSIVTPATIFVFLLCFDWRMALAVLVTVPPVLLVFGFARRLTDRTEAEHDATSAEASARLVEFASAQPVLRANGRSRGGRELLDSALDAQYRSARRQVMGALPGQHLGQLTIQLAFTAILSVGLLLAEGATIGPARVIALLVLGVHFLQPFAVVAGAASSLRVCLAAIERIDTVLATPPLPEPSDPEPVGEPSVELTGIRFGYGPEPVLDGVDLRIPAGTTTALVGPSGAGKTTVTKLVARFFDVEAGSVRIGGVDVRDLAAADLERTVAVVFQDVYLFDASIEDNVRMGSPDATTEQIRDAARRARVDTIVERLPDGWSSRVGEGGRLLSGGERQRVAIARALVKDAPIVLLDEATSALDAENEAAIHEALTELGRDRTLLVIAHRLTTIAGADQIAVLEGGRIVEHGRHAELLAAEGRYARLWTERERARGWRLTGNPT
ncbi:ABC transporter ATP-binding protein [Pseudonocardia spinosispora]|uniref:ABC transporter ATP-binding protein n=1 Tax=Pseudonocardia spinosispora TaxID=103441 RepID=UPI0004215AE7|nr:ABC transporter ATP-binding protein [Pseudonocardia spinosispora]